MDVDLSRRQKLGFIGIVFVLSLGTLFSSNDYLKIAGLVTIGILLIAIRILNFIDFGA